MDLKSRWESLADRERKMLIIGSILVAIILLYIFIWNPISSTAADYKNKVKSQQNLLIYLKNSWQHILRLKARGINVSMTAPSGNILSVVEQSAASHQLSSYLKQVAQPEPNTVTLTFDNVPFDNVISWLENVAETQHLSIQSFSATRTTSAGTANITMTLAQ